MKRTYLNKVCIDYTYFSIKHNGRCNGIRWINLNGLSPRQKLIIELKKEIGEVLDLKTRVVNQSN